MNLHLAIPHGERLLGAPDTPALEKLISIGRHSVSRDPFDVFFCDQTGVPKNNNYPIAAISHLGDTKTLEHKHDDAYYLRADPVHLVLQRDSFSLGENVPLDMTSSDAQQIVSTLNQHFETNGWVFSIEQSGRWYLKLQSPPDIQTSMPEHAIQRDISSFLPQGNDAAKWNTLLNEVQMLLFEHSVNQSRESEGKLAVNSIWLSGEGYTPEKWSGGNKTLIGNAPLLKGVAQLSGAQYLPAVSHLNEILSLNTDETWLVWDKVDDFDDAWGGALLKALKSKDITQLTLHLSLYDYLHTIVIKPLGVWKFWRKPQAIAEFLTKHSQ